MRPTGTAAQLEQRRNRAIELLKSGLNQHQVALQLGCRPCSVCKWQAAYREGGQSALQPKTGGHAPSKMSPLQLQLLPQILLKGALAHGYSTDWWTQRRIAEVIWRQFHARYVPNYIWYIMRRIGWSCQKPKRRATERDDDAVRHWVARDWPRIKKSPARG